MPLDLSRRGFFTGLGASLIAAPAIVRAGSLMPVKSMPDVDALMDAISRGPYEASIFDLQAVVRKAFLPRLFVQTYETSPFLKAALLHNGLIDA